MLRLCIHSMWCKGVVWQQQNIHFNKSSNLILNLESHFWGVTKVSLNFQYNQLIFSWFFHFKIRTVLKNINLYLLQDKQVFQCGFMTKWLIQIDYLLVVCTVKVLFEQVLCFRVRTGVSYPLCSRCPPASLGLGGSSGKTEIVLHGQFEIQESWTQEKQEKQMNGIYIFSLAPNQSVATNCRDDIHVYWLNVTHLEMLLLLKCDITVTHACTYGC